MSERVGMFDRVFGLAAAGAVVASALLVASWLPAWWELRDRALPTLPPAGAAEEPPGDGPPSPEAESRAGWPALFAAAVVEIEPLTGQVVVRRRGSRRPAAAGPDAVDLELVALARSPFRLQLAGYVGEGPQARVLLRHLTSGEVRVVGSDSALPEWRAHVARIDVGRQTTPTDDLAHRPMVARAEVVDLETQERIELDSRVPLTLGPARGEFRCRNSGQRWRGAVGEERLFSGLRLRIEALELDPPLARVTRQGEGAALELHALPLSAP